MRPLDASAAPDSGAALGGLPDASLDALEPVDAFEAADAVEAMSVPEVAPPDCDGGSAAGSATSGLPPADGRCDSNPRLIVSAATLSIAFDGGLTTAAVGSILATPGGLYYTLNASGQSFLGTGSLTRIPLAGGPATVVASDYLFMRPVWNGAGVLVGERGGVSASLPNDAIASFPASGDAPTTLVTLATNEQLLTQPSTDGTFVYYVVQPPGSIFIALRAIATSPSVDAAPITLETGLLPDWVAPLGQELIAVAPQGEVYSLPLPPMPGSKLTQRGTCAAGSSPSIACGSNLCWLAGTNTIEQLAAGSGPPTTVASLTDPVANAFDMAFDGANFYMIGLDAAGIVETLERIPQGGGCPVVVATMPPLGQGSVSVDDECVYWSNSEGIFSLAKTAQGPFQQFQR
ncbi:MAG TPA: hypothetical protein VKU41_23865 [Polyangiaceae bacterium]|nr:hypothetical protein [Polyangiaceae bacterium]